MSESVMSWLRMPLAAACTAMLIVGCAAKPAARISDAWNSRQAVPVVSESIPLDARRAYAIQRKAVIHQLAGRMPAGFKAGLTDAAGQARFGLTEPAAGVLWPDSILDGAQGEIELAPTGLIKPMLEQELGFRFSRLVDQPIKDVSKLRAAVDRIYPAIELPDIAFTPASKLTGLDLIAGNVGARQLILGPGFAPGEHDVNRITATLSRDGQPIQRAEADAAMGDQWQALLWLVNRILKNGWAIRPGQVLITGAMGPMLPWADGHYLADYGAAGSIRFRIAGLSAKSD